MFVCYVRISRTISWLLRFFCYAKIPRSVSCLVCMFVTKEYDTPILLCRLWFVCLLRKNLAHYFMAASFFPLRENPAQRFMSGLFVCYVRISRTISWLLRFFCYAKIPRSVSCLVCMFVTKEYDTPILLCRLWFVCLLRKNLAHYFMAASFFPLRENPAQRFMSGLFVCYARISQIFFFLVCSLVCLFAKFKTLLSAL